MTHFFSCDLSNDLAFLCESVRISQLFTHLMFHIPGLMLESLTMNLRIDSYDMLVYGN